jgi:hypothetical protein
MKGPSIDMSDMPDLNEVGGGWLSIII